MKAKSEIWYDDSYWYLDIPDGWSFTRDRSTQGFPYVIKSDSGSKITIGDRKDVKSSGYDWSVVPDNIVCDKHQQAYVMTLGQTNGRGIRSLSDKHEVGEFVGFTFNQKGLFGKKWAGFFSADPWMFFIRFKANYISYNKDSMSAF